MADNVVISTGQSHLEDHKTYDQTPMTSSGSSTVTQHSSSAGQSSAASRSPVIRSAAKAPAVAPVKTTKPVAKEKNTTTTTVTSTPKTATASNLPAAAVRIEEQRRSSFALPVPSQELTGVARTETADTPSGHGEGQEHGGSAAVAEDELMEILAGSVEVGAGSDSSPEITQQVVNPPAVSAQVVSPQMTSQQMTSPQMAVPQEVVPHVAEIQQHSAPVIKLLPADQVNQLQSRRRVQPQEAAGMVEVPAAHHSGRVVVKEEVNYRPPAEVTYLPPQPLEADRHPGAADTTRSSVPAARVSPGYTRSNVVEVAPMPTSELVSRNSSGSTGVSHRQGVKNIGSRSRSVSSNTTQGYTRSEIIEVVPIPASALVSKKTVRDTGTAQRSVPAYVAPKASSGKSVAGVSSSKTLATKPAVTSQRALPTPSSSLTLNKTKPVVKSPAVNQAATSSVKTTKKVPADFPRWNANRDLNNPGAEPAATTTSKARKTPVAATPAKSQDEAKAESAVVAKAVTVVEPREPAKAAAPAKSTTPTRSVKPAKTTAAKTTAAKKSSTTSTGTTVISKQDAVMNIKTRESGGQVIYRIDP
ncbi:hypothetical protein [Oceanobacter sp. 4_MG-2023]|uniref:hypothetical protein n=1 Tax=Oceanobacter sp. 4_MG-2023 TaxID=3062623 RepID=UPI002734BFA9|nr:hypothetical protein [Oceanobacter sp. 4_MG-2023]MDP2548303.1 hypothetical protein [Oceanobacter sp. 4_MG-2023]